MIQFSISRSTRRVSGLLFPVALCSIATCFCAVGQAQELTLLPPSVLSEASQTPAPLVFDDSAYEAPQRLDVTGVSSIIPAPKSPFVLPPPRDPVLESVPMVPSVVREFVKLQDEQDGVIQLEAPVENQQETEQDDVRSLDEEDIETADDQLMDEVLAGSDDSGLNDDETSEPMTTSPNQVWKLKTIHDVTFGHPVNGEVPQDRSASLLSSATNLGAPPSVGQTVYWVAPNLYYQPLLFEDALLERYGRGAPVWGVQPARSGVHFAIDSFLMPMRAIKYHCEIETPLAFQRPGTCNQPTKEILLPRN